MYGKKNDGIAAQSPIHHSCQWLEHRAPNRPGGPMLYHLGQAPLPTPPRLDCPGRRTQWIQSGKEMW